MAIITFSAVVGDARKKIGGVVFTKGHSGAVVRRKTSPIQPRTQAQSGVRASFTSISKLWGGTSMLNYRAAWNAFASTITHKNKLGEAHTPTGAQLFMSLTRNLASIGAAPVLTPPANLVVTAPGVVTAAYTGPTPGPEAFTITPAALGDSSVWVVVQGASPMSNGKTFVGARYRQIKQALGPVVTDVDILSAYKTKFGAIPAGKTLPLKLFYITLASGARGTPVSVLATS